MSLLSGGVDVTPNGQLINKTVNLAGVRRLDLIATTNSNLYVQAMFGNFGLVPSDLSATPTPPPPASPASATASLDDLAPIQGKPDYTGVSAVGGRDVLHGVGLSVVAGSPRQVSYDIGGHYSQLQVGLAIGDDLPGPAHLDILGDGMSLLSGGVDVTPNGQLISKTVNLAGVRRLDLIATTNSNLYAEAMFGNPKLVP
jgi:hypothetical protein